jgi:hypothetical protein
MSRRSAQTPAQGCVGRSAAEQERSVAASGYDLVLSLGKVVRHVQLKTMMSGGKARHQPVHDSLAQAPSGCVVWIVLSEDLRFDHFLWYGEAPGRPLTKLLTCKLARRARANAQGKKALRLNTRNAPKSAFRLVPDMAGLVGRLFGRTPTAGH